MGECRGSGETGVWPGRETGVEGAGQRGTRWRHTVLGGARIRRARAACWGTTPLPRTVSWAGRPSPGVPLTQPGERPCIHSTNCGLRRPAASVGRGAGRVARSQRVIAAAYGPQISARPARPTDPRTAAATARVGSCSWRPSAALSCVWAGHPRRAAGVLPPRAGSSPHCRGAGWASPWCRRRPSGWAGATRPRPPGSGRGRPACVSPGAGCPRWPPGCWSGS